jgi:hypothetical protein
MGQLSKTRVFAAASLPTMNLSQLKSLLSKACGVVTKTISVGLFGLAIASLTIAGAAEAPKTTGVVSAVATDNEFVIESKGGPVSYKAVVDRKKGGDIKQLCLPANAQSVTDDLNNLFFHGTHGDEYTLRGWSGRDRCILTASAELLSQKPDEVVVRVSADAAGTFKVVSTNPAVKAKLAGKLKSYQEKTVTLKRLYAFRPDRIEVTDEVLWVYPDMEFSAAEWTASYLPGSVQSPARLVKGETKVSFYPVGSGGEKLPQGMTYPFTSETFLKNGWKISSLTTAASFDLRKADLFLYEKPWQTDWSQTSGFKYDVSGQPPVKPVMMKTELAFAKATPAEMPPVVTLRSPGPEARWMDERGEVAKYKIGDKVKLIASAVNADGSPVADKDISWDIRINAWWKRPPVIVQGAQGSFTIPAATNEEERSEAQKRVLLTVIKVTAKGNNGTEATEHFAMLVGK